MASKKTAAVEEKELIRELTSAAIEALMKHYPAGVTNGDVPLVARVYNEAGKVLSQRAVDLLTDADYDLNTISQVLEND